MEGVVVVGVFVVVVAVVFVIVVVVASRIPSFNILAMGVKGYPIAKTFTYSRENRNEVSK